MMVSPVSSTMKVVFFSSKSYDRRFFQEANEAFGHKLEFLESRLDPRTVSLAKGARCICIFVNDTLDEAVLETLNAGGTRLIALRCAGFNQVDLKTAARLGMEVVRVPAYSPHAVAEHTLALLLALNRKIHRAHNRIREGNFSLEGLLGVDLHGLTAGIVGTGKIGINVARILNGFGCNVIAHDPYPNGECREMGVEYVGLKALFSQSDILSLHCPLTPESRYLIDKQALDVMKPGVLIINTSRGGLLDARSAIEALKSGHLGGLAIDVYEEEEALFFEDLSGRVIQDDVFARLTTFPNVLITGHQAFFTREALRNIAETTLQNIEDFEKGGQCPNRVDPDLVLKEGD